MIPDDYSTAHRLRAVVLSVCGLAVGIGLVAAWFHDAVTRGTSLP